MSDTAVPSSPGNGRLVAAFVILPFLQALVAFFAFPVVWWLGGHGSFRSADPSQAAAGFAGLIAFVGVVVIMAGAIPTVRWLMKRGRVALRHFLLAGLLLGNAPFALYVVGLILPFTILHLIAGTMAERWLPVSELLVGTLRALLIGSAFGVMSAAVFWVLGFRRG